MVTPRVGNWLKWRRQSDGKIFMPGGHVGIVNASNYDECCCPSDEEPGTGTFSPISFCDDCEIPEQLALAVDASCGPLCDPSGQYVCDLRYWTTDSLYFYADPDANGNWWIRSNPDVVSDNYISLTISSTQADPGNGWYEGEYLLYDFSRGSEVGSYPPFGPSYHYARMIPELTPSTNPHKGRLKYHECSWHLVFEDEFCVKGSCCSAAYAYISLKYNPYSPPGWYWSGGLTNLKCSSSEDPNGLIAFRGPKIDYTDIADCFNPYYLNLTSYSSCPRGESTCSGTAQVIPV